MGATPGITGEEMESCPVLFVAFSAPSFSFV
jgi:hypothetical protein